MPQRSAMRPTHEPVQSSDQPTQPSRRLYSGRTLLGLAAADALGFALFFSEPALWNADTTQSSNGEIGMLGTIGMILLLVVTAVVAFCDWRGFVSFNGAIKWGRMKGWQKGLLGYFLFPFYMFLVPIYIVQAFKTYRRDRQAEPLRTRLRVAKLEADLGIMPLTEGACPSCGKPLQVGAEFCVYCGKTLVEKPKVCPSCGATALPDARWCPKCRTPLATVDRF